jgi:hypothetical protein
MCNLQTKEGYFQPRVGVSAMSIVLNERGRE